MIKRLTIRQGFLTLSRYCYVFSCRALIFQTHWIWYTDNCVHATSKSSTESALDQSPSFRLESKSYVWFERKLSDSISCGTTACWSRTFCMRSHPHQTATPSAALEIMRPVGYYCPRMCENEIWWLRMKDGPAQYLQYLTNKTLVVYTT